jgi:peptidylprolyl isomerase
MAKKHFAGKQEPKQAQNSESSKKVGKPYMKIALMSIVVILIIAGIFIMAGKSGAGNDTKAKRVLLETTMGNITIELYSNMTITSGNFENLTKKGFYDGTIFHRVMDGFMVQGGDPTGTGMGGPGYTIKDEFVNGSTNLRGTIAMANTGQANSGGSQFFINLVDNTYLDWDKPPYTSKHPVFGKVIEGMDVVDKIGKVQTGAGNKPVKEVKIIKATVI